MAEMPNSSTEHAPATSEVSFADILKEFESSRPSRKDADAAGAKSKGRKSSTPTRRGTVAGVSGDFVLIDYGVKSEGVIPAADLMDKEGNLTVKRGDTFEVTITGRNGEGLVTRSRLTGPRPQDWESLQQAFESKAVIAGRVTGAVKGGLTVDVGARAFLPASRSGARDAADVEKLVGTEIRCRIIKFDLDDE